MITRKRDQKVIGLENTMYIACVNEGRPNEMWHLRLKATHFVLSAVHTKEKVLECLSTICMRYKTLTRLQRELRHCEFGMGVSSLKQCEKEFKEQGSFYTEEIEDIISRCMSELETTRTNKKGGKRVLVRKEPVQAPTETRVKTPEPPREISVTRVKRKSRIGLIR